MRNTFITKNSLATALIGANALFYNLCGAKKKIDNRV